MQIQVISFEKDTHITLSIKFNSGYLLERPIVSYIIMKQEANSRRLK